MTDLFEFTTPAFWTAVPSDGAVSLRDGSGSHHAVHHTAHPAVAHPAVAHPAAADPVVTGAINAGQNTLWGYSPDFWIALGTAAVALATVALIITGLFQIAAIRRQNRRWKTLEVCERYTIDPILDGCLRRLREAHQDKLIEKEGEKYRIDATTVLNYLDGLAIGIYQGLYMEDLARDHLEYLVTGHVSEYLRNGMPKKLGIEPQEFKYLLALATVGLESLGHGFENANGGSFGEGVTNART